MLNKNRFIKVIVRNYLLYKDFFQFRRKQIIILSLSIKYYPHWIASVKIECLILLLNDNRLDLNSKLAL